MTLPGGPADKLGNRYEKWWTLSEFVRLLRGDAEAIRIEDPGVEKAEFVVTTGVRRELHQVKRHHQDGKWSFAALRADGLLRAIGRQLAGNDDRFVFASGSDARQLSELCEAARASESEEEFERAFLAARERRKRFKKLRCDWACDVASAVERLRRIEVRTIDERELERTVRWGVQALFLADPRKVVAELRTIVDDSVHRTITRQALVGFLERRGYRLRHLTSPENAGVAVEAATDTYLEGARSKLIRRMLIPRTAAETLRARLNETATDSVLTGGAGSGKTACVVEVVEALRARGLPVLAFRLDRLPVTPTTAALGGHLGLEESPVLVLAAAAEGAGCPGVLIVDQLDAVSTVSGRTSGMFDLVERLLDEARGTRARAAIHTIVVCREFDWQHDPRLRQLMPRSNKPSQQDERIEVTELAAAEVETVLREEGFDPALFRKRQLELLRLPRNLSLFLEAGFEASRPPAFGTAKDLFDQYWTEKRRSVAERTIPSPDQWLDVMQTLSDVMTDAQQLSVPREALDRFSPDYLAQLASEGVLTFDGCRYGFGHESFFDYCFARVFVTRSESLVSFLHSSEQHLFRRAQVRQVLAYLRGNPDVARYLRELRGLLSSEGIRTHLKDLVFALLADVTDPKEEEWVVWNEWVEPELAATKAGTRNLDRISALAWRRFFGSPSWFAFADERGMIQGWLDSGDDRLADMAVDYLRFHQRHSPDRVAALLEPFAERGGPWAPRLCFVMQWANHHVSRRFFDLFLRLVDNGTLDDARGSIAENSTFSDILHDLEKHRPDWGSEVLAGWLRRRVAVIRAAGEDLGRRGLLGYDHAAVAMFFQAAKNAPAALIEHLLPVVLDISDSALTGGTPPKRDAVWPFLMKTETPSGEDACLSGLTQALATLAGQGAVDLRAVIADLRRRDSYTANHLLLALYGGGGARHADEAVALLRDEPWRFDCGFSDSPHWCAMETIRAIVPHCTAENRDKLEAMILRYVHPYERTEHGYKQAGWAKFALLSAIPEDLRSTAANRHFAELERKFGEPEGQPQGIVGGIVGAPIQKAATEKMTDDQWLRAIEKYRSEDRMHYSGDLLKGGARQLAQVLEQRAKEEPERFARLGLRLPPDANPLYLAHTLNALKDSAIDTDLKLEVCRKAFEASRTTCGRSIVDVLGDIREPLPDDAFRMLYWLATKHEDPAREAWQEDAGGGQPYYNGDIHFNGINTTRGQAADAVRDLILADAACIDRFRPTLERMIRDRSAAVRSCVAGTLRSVSFHDPALGMSLFRGMDLSEDRLLATPHVYQLMFHGLRDNFADLRPLVERMLRSSEPEVGEAGARLAGIAVLVGHESAATLVDDALHGSANHRLGVAQVAAANIADPECRTWSETMLRTLFDDDDTGVRRKTASCFRQLRDETIGTYGELIAAFCDSGAYQDDSFWILHRLEESRGRLPGTTCMVCEKFLDRFADEAKDIRTHRAGDAPTVAKLIFRTYQQHQQDEWTVRSLDLIDRLCLEGIDHVGEEFEQFER